MEIGKKEMEERIRMTIKETEMERERTRNRKRRWWDKVCRRSKEEQGGSKKGVEKLEGGKEDGWK